MASLPKNRLKKPHSKTRTGCSTCKGRHFKCDERKPECLRCMVDGKRCVYNVPEIKLFPPSEHDANNSIPGSAQPHGSYDPLEQRALHYFRERTIPDLNGFTTYTKSFWNSIIPGLSQAEPAIRHIAIALSSQHEAHRSSPDKKDAIRRFCFKHHSLALQTLSRSSPATKEEVLLVSCIAFIAFERFRDLDSKFGTYLGYAIAGLKILREREEIRPCRASAGAFNLVDDFIEPMLFQIELVFSMFCEPERIIINDLPQIDEQDEDIPTEFGDVSGACNAVFRIIAWRHIILHRGEDWSSTSHGFLIVKSQLERWYQSIARLQEQLATNNVEEYQRIDALRKQVRVLSGALLYSVREDTPAKILCRPTLVYLSLPNKVTIFTSIDRNQKVNLSGINGTLCPWPHTKRVGGPNVDNFVVMEFTASGSAC